mmetsp:Transcript_83749/g.237541  ORF Transcript_83749/g.237541 Transcript_83749/m.237541 type:complete len:222 (+) Transcript_83749:55-720(+)
MQAPPCGAHFHCQSGSMHAGAGHGIVAFVRERAPLPRSRSNTTRESESWLPTISHCPCLPHRAKSRGQSRGGSSALRWGAGGPDSGPADVSWNVAGERVPMLVTAKVAIEQCPRLETYTKRPSGDIRMAAANDWPPTPTFVPSGTVETGSSMAARRPLYASYLQASTVESSSLRTYAYWPHGWKTKCRGPEPSGRSKIASRHVSMLSTVPCIAFLRMSATS